ncbi:hypothetical protein [Helcococcus kunzii]|uniref:hypothetical protein n=1 Tax=Helcococcus kunzii TaxID=40091 RepID=UPI0024AE2B07|nr:hypothetical protein [Helcococcus kunzii]
MNMDEISSLYVKNGKLSLFDNLIYHFNSYLSLYLYPYFCLFILLIYVPFKENIYSVITRYEKRSTFFNSYVLNIYKKVILFFIVITVLIFLSGFIITDFSRLNFSKALIEYIDGVYKYDFTNVNYFLFSIVSVLIYFLLLIFLANLFILFTQIGFKPFTAISIITIIMMISSIGNIGYLGELMRKLSIFTIFSGLGYGIYLINLVISILLNIFTYFTAKFIFNRKEIKMIKGNKEYQIY